MAEKPVKTPAKERSSSPKVTAETMATRQRDISVSEFFAKNRHLLGFDNPRKALLTTVKEAVDNSLDACEEAGILPDITVAIEDLQPDRGREVKSSRYRITIVDNGPGIIRSQVEHIFGRLLYGSKFHRLKMSRGQQGIGISAAGMYGLITTGKPMLIQTRPKASRPAHHIELAINTKTNRAEVTLDEETDDFPLQRLRTLSPAVRDLSDQGQFLAAKDYPTGTSVTIELEGKYQRGRGSVDEFLELTAIANPHARFTFVRPTRESAEEDDTPLLKKGKKDASTAPSSLDASMPHASMPSSDSTPPPAAPAITTDLGDLIIFPRAVNELPPETKEIQPHPRGVELGTLLQMLKDYEVSEKGGSLYNFLQERFSRISAGTASDLCKAIKVTSHTKVRDIEAPQAEALYKAFQTTRFLPPPTDCLAPIGVRQLLAGMLKGVRAEFYAASSREAAIYRGRPFLIETAIAFGGELPADDTARVIRFANRVPLLFQQSACSSFKAVTETAWRNYNLQQPRGSIPTGPLVIMIHMASVWVPFTSESKEAIADYDEIRKEMKLALMECGRKLGTYLRKRQAMRRQGERRDVFERYIGEIAQAVNAINGTDAKKLYDALLAQAKKQTAIADLQLDDEGKAIKENAEDQEGVIVVAGAMADSEASPPGGKTPAGLPDSPSLREGAGGGFESRPSPPRRSKSKSPSPSSSRAEAAALKVAAMRGDDDHQPALLDVAEPKRLTRKGESPRAKAPPEAKLPPKNTLPPPKPAAASPAAPPTASTSKPAKLRMRLVNGKLVNVDDGPKLF